MAALFVQYQMLKAKFEEAGEDRGATIVEYALVLAVISLVLLTGAAVLTGAVNGFWTTLAGRLP